MTSLKKSKLIAVLEAIRDYPKEDNPRRDNEGYPLEVVYDEFAYKRMVDNYRSAAREGLKGKESTKK